MRKYQIGVIGSAGNEEYSDKNKQRTKIYNIAKTLGKLIAQQGAILITGGKGGVMEASCRGAKSVGGITVGFVRGKERFTSNNFTDIEVVSGMEGCGEETMLVLSCDGIIAIGGGAGTLQELVIAYRNKKPVVVIDSGYGWASKLENTYLDERNNEKFFCVKTPKRAISLLLKNLK